MVAHWRPWRNLQFLDYVSGNVIHEMDADANNPHYLTTAKYIGKNKDFYCNKNAMIIIKMQ